jgi:hypothetical protein
LGVSGAGAGATGDFNSDGNLDILIPSYCQPGIQFVPGKGDGTFGSPVPLNVVGAMDATVPLVGDFNNDKKLDFIWQSLVFLGNGDGTFKQLPLTTDANVVAIADLNGDGILDAVSSSGTLGNGSAVYAGNGDGTFQATPFYTVPLPTYTSGSPIGYTYEYSISIGDVNGDWQSRLTGWGAGRLRSFSSRLFWRRTRQLHPGCE